MLFWCRLVFLFKRHLGQNTIDPILVGCPVVEPLHAAEDQV